MATIEEQIKALEEGDLQIHKKNKAN